RIGNESDTCQDILRSREHERAVARDLVPPRIITQLRRLEPSSVLGDHNDVASGFHVPAPYVVCALSRRERGVLDAGLRVKRTANGSKLEARVVVVRECGIGLQQ